MVVISQDFILNYYYIVNYLANYCIVIKTLKTQTFIYFLLSKYIQENTKETKKNHFSSTFLFSRYRMNTFFLFLNWLGNKLIILFFKLQNADSY